MPISDNPNSMAAEIAALRSRLEETEETLRAIRSGEVDALLIGDQVYTLESADAASNRFRGEILAQINEVVVAINDEMRITYLNPAAERQYGVQASDVLGKRLEELYQFRFVTPEDEAAWARDVEKNGFWRGENIHLTNDGRSIHVESTVSRLLDRDGNSQGMFAVIRDISDRIRAEVELQRAHDKLEERVIERTRELAETNAALEDEIRVRVKTEGQRAELLKKVVTSQEDERRRIARDIHDQLGQRITALRLQIASFGESLQNEKKYARRIEILTQTAERLDSEVSFLAWELRPAALDDLGLAEAIQAFLDDWAEQYQIPAFLSVRGFADRRLDTSTETHLYRIIQEALNNIVKHANAHQVNVLLERVEGEVTLIVEDDGDGFDPQELESPRHSGKGLGLVGMKERVLLVGGHIEFESSEGLGTTIYVRVPDSSPEASDQSELEKSYAPDFSGSDGSRSQ